MRRLTLGFGILGIVAIAPMVCHAQTVYPTKPTMMLQCAMKKAPAGQRCDSIMEVDLPCYRECVQFCQDATQSVADEQECIRSQCLEGGPWGCGSRRRSR